MAYAIHVPTTCSHLKNVMLLSTNLKDSVRNYYLNWPTDSFSDNNFETAKLSIEETRKPIILSTDS